MLNVPAFHFLVFFGTATCSASLCLSLKPGRGERGMVLLSNGSLFGQVAHGYGKERSVNSVDLGPIQEFYFVFQNQAFPLQKSWTFLIPQNIKHRDGQTTASCKEQALLA